MKETSTRSPRKLENSSSQLAKALLRSRLNKHCHGIDTNIDLDFIMNVSNAMQESPINQEINRDEIEATTSTTTTTASRSMRPMEHVSMEFIMSLIQYITQNESRLLFCHKDNTWKGFDLGGYEEYTLQEIRDLFVKNVLPIVFNLQLPTLLKEKFLKLQLHPKFERIANGYMYKADISSNSIIDMPLQPDVDFKKLKLTDINKEDEEKEEQQRQSQSQSECHGTMVRTMTLKLIFSYLGKLLQISFKKKNSNFLTGLTEIISSSFPPILG